MRHSANFHERRNFKTNEVFFDKMSKKCNFAIEQHFKKKFFLSFQQLILYLHCLNSLRFYSRFFCQFREFRNKKFSKLIDEILEILFLFNDILFSRNIVVWFKKIRNADNAEFQFLIFAFVNDKHFRWINRTQELNKNH